MARLSQRLLTEVIRTCHRAFHVRPRPMDLTGRIFSGRDPLSPLSRVRRERTYALHESVNIGAPFTFAIGPAVTSWLIALEDQRIIHAALIGGEIICASRDNARHEQVEWLVNHGLARPAAQAYVKQVPTWPMERIDEAAALLEKTFYQVSGWTPVLMEENRLRIQQQTQITQAIEDQRQRGEETVYPFQKERVLLALIRAGDKTGARRVLNEMLAAMYMSSPKLVLLRARAIEMMGYLTRAAVEDSPVLEPLIERNHRWMARLIHARDFEILARVLTEALNDFIEGISLHGFNRSNIHVGKALDFMRRNHMKTLTLETVAHEVGLSSYRIAHLLKDHTGKSFVHILHQIRVQRAQHLLEESDKAGTEIAYEVGFGDQSYFIKHFRRHMGMTPAQYRRLHGQRAVATP